MVLSEDGIRRMRRLKMWLCLMDLVEMAAGMHRSLSATHRRSWNSTSTCCIRTLCFDDHEWAGTSLQYPNSNSHGIASIRCIAVLLTRTSGHSEERIHPMCRKTTDTFNIDKSVFPPRLHPADLQPSSVHHPHSPTLRQRPRPRSTWFAISPAVYLDRHTAL